MEVKFHHCTVLQKGEAFIYYMYNRELDGFLIASLVCASNTEAKVNLASLLKYFFTEIVRKKDAYCSLFDGEEDNFFPGHTVEHTEINGMPIYKIDF